MKILVTGAAGKLGQHVTADLIGHGHTVLAVDRVPTPGGVPFTVADLTDYGQVAQLLSGVDSRERQFDAVVHLGAIPGAGHAPNSVIFTNNTTASYNVFEAARVARIRKVVWASSETLLGIPFDIAPPYLPVDEDYAVRPESSYSLGKAVEEELARQFARWSPDTSIIGLRFSNVMAPEDYLAFEAWQQDPSVRAWNLWGYIDARDGAQAVRLALEVDLPGADVFVIAAEDTVMRRESADLISLLPEELPITAPVVGRQSLLSSTKARTLLGYSPQHSWLDENPSA